MYVHKKKKAAWVIIDTEKFSKIHRNNSKFERETIKIAYIIFLSSFSNRFFFTTL